MNLQEVKDNLILQNPDPKYFVCINGEDNVNESIATIQPYVTTHDGGSDLGLKQSITYRIYFHDFRFGLELGCTNSGFSSAEEAFEYLKINLCERAQDRTDIPVPENAIYTNKDGDTIIYKGEVFVKQNIRRRIV